MNHYLGFEVLLKDRFSSRIFRYKMIKKIEKLLLKYFWPPSASFGKFLGQVSKPRTAATEKTKLYWTIRFRIDAMMSSRSFKEEIEKRKSKLHFGKTKVVLMNITLMKSNWGVERKQERERDNKKKKKHEKLQLFAEKVFDQSCMKRFLS